MSSSTMDGQLGGTVDETAIIIIVVCIAAALVGCVSFTIIRHYRAKARNAQTTSAV